MPDMTHVLLVQAVCLQFPKYKPNNKYAGRIEWAKMTHEGSINAGTGFESVNDS